MDDRRDRRRARRFEVNPVVCRCGPETDRPGLCVVRNISLQGAYVVSPKSMRPGVPVRLQFSTAPLEGYELTGTVVRQETGRPKGFAVRFNAPRPRLLRVVYHAHAGH